MNKYAIIVAGGKGLRMGRELPKQFLPLEGKPVLMRTVERFVEADPAIRIVLVLPAAHQAYWKSLCAEYGFSLPYVLADGGETRFHSVKNGLQQVDADGWIAVHDGVRPFVSVETIRRCFDEAVRSGAAVPCLPVIETLREQNGAESRTVDRQRFRTVQTPQVFRARLLKEAYEQPYSGSFTDDASVVEAAGHRIALVEGNRENIKITEPFDLRVGEMLCRDA